MSSDMYPSNIAPAAFLSFNPQVLANSSSVCMFIAGHWSPGGQPPEKSHVLKEVTILVWPVNSDPTGIDFPIPGNDDARRSIDLYCNLIKETINNAKSSIPIPEPKKEVANDKKEKTQGKTVQEIDREKLEQKFSKDKKETLN